MTEEFNGEEKETKSDKETGRVDKEFLSKAKNSRDMIDKELRKFENSIENISETLEKLMEKMNAQQPAQEYLQWVKAQVGDSISLIPVDKIYFFQARDKYTTVMTKDEEYLIRKTIAELAEELDPALFFRIHRGTIVNARLIDKINTLPGSRGQLKLKDRPEIHTISRSYSHRFKQM